LQVAASDADGELTLNITGDSRSSSALERNEQFAGVPGWEPKESRAVAARRLDGLVAELLRPQERAYLKLDVQGYERKVIEGGRDVLDRVVGLRVELSVLKCYEGEALLCDMLPYLDGLGFKLTGIEPAWSDERTQEVFQLDGIFFRVDRLAGGGPRA
jgi:hypothetical protein